MAKSFAAPVLAASLLVSACSQDIVSSKESAGTVIGSMIGIVVGSQLGSGTGRAVSAAVGGLAGAWIGKEIGRRLDERDLEMSQETADEALESGETGETGTWSNPDSGNSGSVTPTSDAYQTAENNDCRDFESTVTVDGETEVAHGRACRQPDGSWKIVQ